MKKCLSKTQQEGKRHCIFRACALPLVLFTLLNISDYADASNVQLPVAQLGTEIYTYSDGEKFLTLHGGDQPTVMLCQDRSTGKRYLSAFLSEQTEQTVYFQSVFGGFTDDQNGWLALQSAPAAGVVDTTLFLTDNGGDTWKEVSMPENFPRHKINDAVFVDENTGYLCCSLFDRSPAPVFMTSDRGEHWTEIELPLQQTANTYYQVSSIRDIDGMLVCTVQSRTDSENGASYHTQYLGGSDFTHPESWSEIAQEEVPLLTEKIRDWEDGHLFRESTIEEHCE